MKFAMQRGSRISREDMSLMSCCAIRCHPVEFDLFCLLSCSPESDSNSFGELWNRFRYMQRAALYARVSTDAQKQEGTIESQIAELRRQIAAAGHALVKVWRATRATSLQ